MKNSIDNFMEWQNKCIKRDGWFSHLVFDDKTIDVTGFNAHTHHVPESFSHFDFQIVVPLQFETVNGIFTTLINQVRDGRKFEVDKEYDQVIVNHKVRFIMTTESRNPPVFEKPKTIDRPLLRLILPAPNGSLYAKTMKAGNRFLKTVYQSQEKFTFAAKGHLN